MTAKSPRLVGAFVALVAVGSALSGCGGSSSASPVGATASASAPVTKAQAAAYAQAVNLQAADLPGMSVRSPESESPPPNQLGREEERCAGTVNPNLSLVKIHSATFAGAAEAEHEQIRSAVEVMPTATLAARNNAASQSQRALACAARFAPRLLARENAARVHYGPLAITRLPNPLPGAPGSFGIRIAITILGVPAAIEPTQPHLYIDAFGFLSGPAEVDLIATAFPQPVSEEAEARLLSLLYSRAQAHKL
jgi:hypothetical protein